jgi:hypothetical protein
MLLLLPRQPLLLSLLHRLLLLPPLLPPLPPLPLQRPKPLRFACRASLDN